MKSVIVKNLQILFDVNKTDKSDRDAAIDNDDIEVSDLNDDNF